MNRKTRKLMTMHKALHPRDNIDRLYVSRKDGRKGLASIVDSVDASIRGLEDYTKKSKERLISATRNTADNIMIIRTKTRKQKWEEKTTCINSSSTKLVKFHTRRPEHG